MKVSILSKIISTPTGGGNQFLKALKNELIKRKIYEENPFKADIILFNSFNFLVDGLFQDLIKLKKMGKIIVHRVDGPISIYRGKDIELDKIIFESNYIFADATVFQSKWSMDYNKKMGLKTKGNEIIINNAPHNSFFYPSLKNTIIKKNKIKIVSTSWSNNFNKGFDVYKWLDLNLDFNKYEMTFVGNSLYEFKNIKHIAPVSSKELGEILRANDIFIFASKIEACSNSLLEALHTNLPCIAYSGSSNPEILGSHGLLFSNKEEIPELLNKIVINYESFLKSFSNLKKIEHIADSYVSFFKELDNNNNNSTFSYYKIYITFFKYNFWRIKNKIKGIFL